MPRNQNQHLAWIDILRGLASFGVVLFHVRRDLWVGWINLHLHPERFSAFDWWVSYLSIPMPFLGSGVMLFFLVSGFCIHWPQSRNHEWSVATYAIRRFWRIYPPYLAAVILTVVAERIAAAISPQPISTMPHIFQVAVMAQNYSAGQLAGNASLWTLPIEVELYLAYPLFLGLLWKFSLRPTMMVVGSVSIAASLLWLTGRCPWVEGNFAKFWIIWCAGAALAEGLATGRLPRWKNRYWVLTALSFAGCLIARNAGMGGGLMHYGWAFAYFLVLWWLLSNPPLPQRMAAVLLRALTFLGAISYSLYLIHVPYFKVMAALWTHWIGKEPASVLIPIAFAVSAIPVAYAFYRCVEAPCHYAARHFAKSTKKITLTPAPEMESA